jgi:glycosyltransferase involved in cell wall biosynthesis
VTRLRPGKGLETLIDAVPAVIARHPAARVAIVGDGPLREELVVRARRVGVEHVLEFLGEHPDPRAVLNAADVFVLPSLAESFPYVVLEAMSQALPVVASDVGGIAEAVVDGESGLLVEPGDPRALAQATCTLLDDGPTRARLGARGRSDVEERFTRARMISALSAVYEEVLSEEGA